MNIVVTGGAGFIGSHVAEKLIEAGHKALVIDNLSSGKTDNIPAGAQFQKMDIVDGDLASALESFRADAVCHHAAQISVRNSINDPVADLTKNIIGTVRLLEACRRSGCRTFIFASTGGALYGDQERFPAPESHPTYPLSPYGISKLSAEKYLFFYRKQYGFRGVCLRYSNVYGPRQDPHGEAGVVAIFCKKLLAGEVPTINGDGMQSRDFVFVKDVARANLLAIEKYIEGEFNIATGIETDVNTLAGELLKISGKDAKLTHGPSMPGEQRRSLLDPSLAFEKLGWRPEVALSDGMKQTWQFFANERR